MATIKIQPGQTLTGIAQQQGTSVQDLLKVNPQITNPDLIFAGADLTLPGQNTAATVNTPPSTLDVNTVIAQTKPVEMPTFEEVDTTNQFVSSLRPPQDQANQGFKETLPTFQDVFKQADAITEPVQEERRGLLTRIEESLGRLTGRGARQAELEQLAGVPENIKRLQQLNEQIAQTQGEFEKQIAAIPGQGRGITTGIVVGQQARAKRQQAVEVGALSSVAQALQGNIALAQQTAQRTADLEFEPVQQEIDKLRILLDINADEMTTAEKRRAELLSVQLDERQRVLDEQKSNKESIITFAAEASQNGADNVTVNNILKAKTPEEALSIGSQFQAERVIPEPTEIGTDAFGNPIFGVFNQETRTFDPVQLPKSVTMDTGELQNRVLDLTAGLSFGSVAEREDAKRGILNALASGDTEGAKEILQTAVFNGATGTQQDTLEGKQNTLDAINRIEQALNEYTNRGGDPSLLSEIEFGKNKETGLYTEIKLKSLERLGRTLDPQLNEIANDIALAIVDYRRAVSGAAFTESEGRAYERIFPSVGNAPELNQTKINSIRTKLQADTDNFYKNRIGASRYESLFGTTSTGEIQEAPVLRSSFTTVENLLRTQPEFEPLVFAMQSDGLDDEEIRFVLEDQYSGFNQPLSMGVNGSNVTGIKDFTRVSTNIGTGTATGIEQGSKFWKYGYDFVLDGGKGAPVKSPVSGTVIRAGKEGDFGNRVRIKLDDGRVIAAAHLDNIMVKPGTRISAGQVFGTQGNTGKTYGPTGVHIDWTLYDKDGNPKSSKEAASFLNTRKV